jgi:pyruvate formate lyase activating enzyme
MECREVDKKGLIFNIQRFSVHDGPGIRTTVFMQGCSLKCRWCANPESWKNEPVIMARDAKCMGCGKCVEACAAGAITMDEEKGRLLDFSLCTQCGECAEVCPTRSLSTSGKFMSIEEVVSVAERDSLFYRNSGGGVTISGGEPALQSEFAEALVKALKAKGFHVSLDTCGEASWDKLERILNHVDLVLYDIKHMDTRKHKIGTGSGNERILENAEKASRKAKMWLRVPLMGGYNDSEEHIADVAELARRIGAEKISLLPYHRWGESKFEQLGLRCTWEAETPESDDIEKLEGIIRSAGVEVGVGS